jgi:hypothetical protein
MIWGFQHTRGRKFPFKDGEYCSQVELRLVGAAQLAWLTTVRLHRVYLSIYLPVYLFTCLSTCLSIHLSIHTAESNSALGQIQGQRCWCELLG